MGENLKELNKAIEYLINNNITIDWRPDHFRVWVNEIGNSISCYYDWIGMSYCAGALLRNNLITTDFIYRFEKHFYWHCFEMNRLPEIIIKRNKVGFKSEDWTPWRVRETF